MAWPLLSLVACGAVHRNHRSSRLVANLEPTAGSAASAPAERWVAAYASLPAPVTRAWHGLLASEGRVHLLSGATAAAVSNSIVAPLDLIRLNMMVAKTQVSAMTMARRIFAENGVPGFWRGNSADVARAMPASAIRFYSFALAKANLPTLLPIALATPLAAGASSSAMPAVARALAELVACMQERGGDVQTLRGWSCCRAPAIEGVEGAVFEFHGSFTVRARELGEASMREFVRRTLRGTPAMVADRLTSSSGPA